MMKLLGEYDVSVDAKGRFLLPVAFRKQLPDGAGIRFIINRGFENCLCLYTIDVWDKLTEKLNRLNDLKPEVRKFKRLFLNGATEITPDSADRILLPRGLMEYAGIVKDMILTGQTNKAELWDKDTYNKYLSENGDAESFSKLAEDVANDLGNLFDNM